MQIKQIDSLDWSKQDGLIPAVVQDAQTLRVLMLGYMNKEALKATIETGQVTFFSRSRNKQWVKGETSGNHLQLKSICFDCDKDALLVQAKPHGPTCHLGTQSCFEEAPFSFVHQLDAVICERKSTPVAGSYTQKLFAAGSTKIAQKVGEEGVETALAAVVEEDDALLAEAADLIYHTMVLLRSKDLSFTDVSAVLEQRHSKS